ncbi:MAG: cytochrome c maturation protein CcmE [Ectothiorhodospiraceae bacterium]|jgi:cytochrome c-type biogenesis protein CcmE
MTPRRKRMVLIGMLVVGVGAAVGLTVSAFRQNMTFFYSPSEVAAGDAPVGYPFRMGGLVADGSVERPNEGLAVHFVVTDGNKSIPVSYSGILPDLFREGQGVVVRGRLGGDGMFTAQEVLAKHDEKYMPPEVKDALKKGKALANPHAKTSKP